MIISRPAFDVLFVVRQREDTKNATCRRLLEIAVGTAIAGRHPHRSVLEALPHTAQPWIMTSCVTLASNRPDPIESLLVRQTVRANWEPFSVSGPITTVCRSPREVPFLPRTPQPFSDRLCSPASQIPRDCLTSQERNCRHCEILPSPTNPFQTKRIILGSPSFREKSIRPCAWPHTP